MAEEKLTIRFSN